MYRIRPYQPTPDDSVIECDTPEEVQALMSNGAAPHEPSMREQMTTRALEIAKERASKKSSAPPSSNVDVRTKLKYLFTRLLELNEGEVLPMDVIAREAGFNGKRASMSLAAAFKNDMPYRDDKESELLFLTRRRKGGRRYLGANGRTKEMLRRLDAQAL